MNAFDSARVLWFNANDNPDISETTISINLLGEMIHAHAVLHAAAVRVDAYIEELGEYAGGPEYQPVRCFLKLREALALTDREDGAPSDPSSSPILPNGMHNTAHVADDVRNSALSEQVAQAIDEVLWVTLDEDVRRKVVEAALDASHHADLVMTLMELLDAKWNEQTNRAKASAIGLLAKIGELR